MNQDPFADLQNIASDDVDEEPSVAVPNVLKHKPSTSSRNRKWEADQRRNGVVATYRGIPPELKAKIAKIARKHHVPVGEVARAFLEHALVAYKAGELELNAQFGTGKLTLYPE